MELTNQEKINMFKSSVGEEIFKVMNETLSFSELISYIDNNIDDIIVKVSSQEQNDLK